MAGEGREGGSGTQQGRDFTEERKATEMHPARRGTVAVAQQHKDRAGGGVVACSLTLYPSAFLTWQSRSTSLPTGTVMLSISPTKDGAEAEAAAAASLTVCASGGGRQAPESSRLVVATPGTMEERTQYFTFLIVNLAARVIK